MTFRPSKEVRAEKIAQGKVIHHTNEAEAQPTNYDVREPEGAPPEDSLPAIAARRQKVREEKIKEGKAQKKVPPDPPEAQKTQHDQGDNGEQELQNHEEKFFQELLKRYTAAVVTSEELESIEIASRAKLLGEWLSEGDLGFIYGERGSGKTWLVAGIATSVSAGTDLNSWEAHGAFPVLYIDGEMPIDLTRDRLKGLSPKNKNLNVLHHEQLFNTSDRSINIVDPPTQRVITELCLTRSVKLLILDNLSCLASGMKENDADEWEKLLNWLLDLRRRRVAVIIVHHAGATGQRMRGTTKREDPAAWVIKVEEIKGEYRESEARFETSFTKRPRGSTVVEWTRSWTFKTEATGDVSIGCEEISVEGKVLQLIQDGLETATEIAEELHCSKSQASKIAVRLQAKKLIEIKKRHYSARGFMAEK